MPENRTGRRYRVKTIFVVLLTLAISFAPMSAAMEPPRADQKAFLSRAVFVDGRLWLLTDAGELSSIAVGVERRMDEAQAEPVNDICVHRGKLLAVTCAREECEKGSLRQLDHGSWTVRSTFPAENDRVLALGCANTDVTVLTDRRLINLNGDVYRSVKLAERLDVASIAAVHDMPEVVYVGFNSGEWGGGLRRISRRTGKITTIESNASGGVCGGPLNTDCDPVNSIVTSPWNNRCVAAAIGLVHFLPHGRIVEVCGTKVRRLYFNAYEMQGIDDRQSTDRYEPFDLAELFRDEPDSTTAFYGLLPQRNSLWAIGIDGLYKIGKDGSADITSMPEFKEIGGVYVNFDLSEVILVLTQVNQRRSLSGAVPLLVPREPRTE